MEENSGFGKQLVDEKQAAEILGLSVRTLQARRYFKQPPAFIKLSRAVRYRLSDLENYISDCTVIPTYNDAAECGKGFSHED